MRRSPLASQKSRSQTEARAIRFMRKTCQKPAKAKRNQAKRGSEAAAISSKLLALYVFTATASRDWKAEGRLRKSRNCTPKLLPVWGRQAMADAKEAVRKARIQQYTNMSHHKLATSSTKQERWMLPRPQCILETLACASDLRPTGKKQSFRCLRKGVRAPPAKSKPPHPTTVFRSFCVNVDSPLGTTSSLF